MKGCGLVERPGISSWQQCIDFRGEANWKFNLASATSELCKSKQIITFPRASVSLPVKQALIYYMLSSKKEGV